jgi:hypothetical protein
MLRYCHRPPWRSPPPGTVRVAVGGDEHVDDLPVVVDRPVDVAPDSVVQNRLSQSYGPL